MTILYIATTRTCDLLGVGRSEAAAIRRAEARQRLLTEEAGEDMASPIVVGTMGGSLDWIRGMLARECEDAAWIDAELAALESAAA